MIVALQDELGELLPGIGVEGVMARAMADVGNLGPYKHPHLVAQRVKFLCGGVVGQPDAVGSNVLYQRHVLAVFAAGDGPTHAVAVLVTIHTAKRELVAVEEKAPVRVHLEISDTDVL